MKLLERLDSSTDSLHRLAFWALLVVAIALRVVAFQGFADSDPRAYAIIADKLSHGVLSIPGYPGPPVFPLRIGTYGPSAALISLFGLSEVALVAYPFVISLASCVLIYFFARHALRRPAHFRRAVATRPVRRGSRASQRSA